MLNKIDSMLYTNNNRALFVGNNKFINNFIKLRVYFDFFSEQLNVES